MNIGPLTNYCRQRNMLAIKFYNLQALVHRPLLAPPQALPPRSDSTTFYRAENIRVSPSKIKCIKAAQETAKLLHNIEDKQSLVYEFPWWQMISCLICASSILLIASSCVDPVLDGHVYQSTDWEAVDEDAEVCLKVFQALSSNSNAARLARDMMQRLKKTRTQGELFSCSARNPSHQPSGISVKLGVSCLQTRLQRVHKCLHLLVSRQRYRLIWIIFIAPCETAGSTRRHGHGRTR